LRSVYAVRCRATRFGPRSDCPGALRPWPGGWPLPAAGGRRTRCGRARPNPSPAVASEDEAQRPRLEAAGLRPLVSEGATRRTDSDASGSLQLPSRRPGDPPPRHPVLRTRENRRAPPAVFSTSASTSGCQRR